MKRILLVILVVASLAVPSAVSAATAPPKITIDFTGDTAGAVPNNFQSVASSSVSFSDTMGADLTVFDFGTQSDGQALIVNSDDASALQIKLAHPTTALSLAFGNDDPAVLTTSDKAVLKLFRGSKLVATKSVLVNANDVMDQRIGQKQGPLFNRAMFQYVLANGTPANLIEIVDDISINPLCTIAGNEHPTRFAAETATKSFVVAEAVTQSSPGVATTRCSRGLEPTWCTAPGVPTSCWAAVGTITCSDSAALTFSGARRATTT